MIKRIRSIRVADTNNNQRIQMDPELKTKRAVSGGWYGAKGPRDLDDDNTGHFYVAGSYFNLIAILAPAVLLT